MTSRRNALLSLASLSLLAPSVLCQTPGCNALQLTRSASYVRVPHNSALVPARITVEAWVQLASNFPGRGTIARKNPAANAESWNLRIETGRVNFAVRGTSFFSSLWTSTQVPTNQPVHVAATYDGASLRIYINGVQTASQAAAIGNIVNNGGDLRIGQGDGTSTEQFLGKLDEVRIWNTALTATQIASNYRRILNKVTNEVASYSFDNNYNDSTGSFHGTLVGTGASFGPSMYDFGRYTTHPKGSLVGTEYAGHVSNLGDLDGDGFEDYGVGHGNATNSLANRGAFRAYSGRDHKELFAYEGATAGARFGWHTDGGDLDGDGYSDAIVGEPGRNGNRGIIWVISGKTKVIRFFAQGSGTGEFGDLVLAAPYLDADGLCDVVTTDGMDLVALRANGSQLWRVTPLSGDRARSIDLVGDVNQDGSDDIIIGMPTYDGPGGTDEGTYQVRSGRDGSLLFSLRGGQAGMRAGWSVAGIHADINGDKVPDYVIGSPGYNNKSGLLSVIDGRTRAILKSVFGGSGQELGLAICAAEGDVNGDGTWDARATGRVSGNGRVYVFDAKNGTLPGYLQGGATSPDFGSSIVGIETNGRPFADIIVAEKDVAASIWDGCPIDIAPVHSTYGATCDGTGARRPRLAVVDKSGIRVNGTYTMRISSARASSATALQLGVGRLNLALDGLGMIGCKYLLGQSIVTSTRPLDGNGIADVTYTVPNDVTLAGVKVTFQALCLDVGGNAFNLTTSNGTEIVHGTRL
ncbi:MAG: FG-GAP repeat protein [Planctomycetes bacterium]|nr:FG-GAP repeat protein [Planctomycetota bacterium]MCB9891615.1 FG-GAP repeat protein [Planctomycetota bacterium]MCB9917888.1 FG-GAP repeat protein [Planctomycetota bacterium]